MDDPENRSSLPDDGDRNRGAAQPLEKRACAIMRVDDPRVGMAGPAARKFLSVPVAIVNGKENALQLRVYLRVDLGL